MNGKLIALFVTKKCEKPELWEAFSENKIYSVRFRKSDLAVRLEILQNEEEVTCVMKI